MPNGILIVDKPAGWTSQDVAAKLRGVFHEKRIGHGGTLDPMATGVLPIFIGRATRAVPFFEHADKAYEATLRLGLVTDTQDVTGRTLEEHQVDITYEQLESILARFRGEIQQLPPMYSAIKVKGQKLYEIARRGGEVERAPRSVTIRELRLLGREGQDFLLDVTCSKGTYIRTLCHDIGAALGCGACMSALRRVRAGDFSLESAHTLEEVQRAADENRAETLLLPVDALFERCPALVLNAAEERRIRVGASVPRREAEGEYRLYGAEGAFLALGSIQNGELRSIKSFFEVST